MKETPLMFLGLRVERSTHLKLSRIVKASGKTLSEYVREIITEYLNQKKS